VGVVPDRAHPPVTEDVLPTGSNPEHVAVELPPVSGAHAYLPAIDGLRALAVAGVVAYHFSLHWADGGFLGVDFFFVLSGFLITGLLVGEWDRHHTIALRSFWFRRSKRLMPAVMVLLVTLSVYAGLGGPNIVGSTFSGDAIATLFYYANWHLIAAHQSYFTQFTLPSPLRHTWSLAIEEQFYLVWPVVILAGLRLSRKRNDRPSGPTAATTPAHRRPRAGMVRPAAFWCTVGLATASAAWMIVLFERGADLSRIYYGTDTRAFELLIGASLALLVTGRPEPSPRVRRTLHVAAPVAAVVLGVLWVTAGDDAGNPAHWMFQGGLVLAGVLAAVVIAGVAQPDPGGFGRLLSFRPLRWVGRISYGIYLWHWPVYVLMTDVTTGLSGLWLLAARLAATVGAATLSFYLIERPVRRYPWKGVPYLAVMSAAAVATVIAVLVGSAASTTPQVSVHLSRTVQTVGLDALPHPTPAPLQLPAGRVLSPADPLRILTIGDSVMYDAEAGLQAALQSTGVVRLSTHGFPGWGLINDPTFQRDLASAIATYHPEIILAMWSWDNAYARARPAEYERLLTAAVDTMLSPGDGVDGIAIIQFPKAGPGDEFIDPVARQQAQTSAEADRQAFDHIVATLPARYPGRITYLPVAPVLEVHGQFSAWLPTVDGGWVRARKLDNVHLCPAGAAVLAAKVTSELRPMFDLPPMRAGWINASWTEDAGRYDDPVGGCPNDQPPG
jgi:peptidoglycan/LPS O-acetylase OafA/YrhL